MAPRMGPSFEKGRRRAIVWPIVALVAAIVIYFVFIDNSGDSTPTDEPLQPATENDIATPETEAEPGQE